MVPNTEGALPSAVRYDGGSSSVRLNSSVLHTTSVPERFNRSAVIHGLLVKSASMNTEGRGEA